MRILAASILVFSLLVIESNSTAGSIQQNSNSNSVTRALSIEREVISVTDSGWFTDAGTSDCVNGQADQVWQLTLTTPRNLTVTVVDCCCPGDFFEIRVNGNLIGTTPNLAPPWGCSQNGPLSSGSFTTPLCPGTYTITIRDAGFDNHTPEEIASEGMCPAGFSVSGTLSDFPLITLDGSDSLFQFDPATGDYSFRACGGSTITGRGTVIIKGSIVTLQHNSSDRRVVARLDRSANIGTATVQLFAEGKTYTISDKDTTNRTCSCP